MRGAVLLDLLNNLDSDVCFYCGGLVTHDCERDHFPIPKCAAGELTVPCCRSCHDMKDRYPLAEWPTEWIAKVIADFPKLNRETKLFLAKIMRVAAEAMLDREDAGATKQRDV